MALADEFIRTPSRSAQATGFGVEVFRTIGLSLSALAAGWHAADDYRRMSGSSHRQLRSRGISDEELPQEIYRRHFARLGERRNCG